MYYYRAQCPPTGVQVREQLLQPGVTVQVVVLGHVAPERLDCGPALVQEPGEERVHGLMSSFSSILF